MASGELDTVLRHLRRVSAEPGGLSDAQLLERFARHREEAAFELLVWRHGRMVLAACRRILHDAHDAEDAFQATFLALARKAGSIGKGEAVAAWLHRVACRAALRARGDRRLTPADPDAFPDPGRDPTEEAAWRELRPVLDQEVGLLPERYRVPVVLCYLEGRTYDEAARVLGCSRGTVGTRLARARELLRKRLVRRGVSLSAAALAGVLGIHAAQADAPASLVGLTVKAALLFAAGKEVGAVPARTVALAEGVLRAMWMTRLKTPAVVLLLAVLFSGLGAGAWGLRPAEAEPPQPPPAPPAPPPAEAERPAAGGWREPVTLAGPEADVTGLAFSPTDKRLTAVSADGMVWQWDPQTGRRVREFEAGLKPRCVTVGRDGKALVFGGTREGKTVGVVSWWDPARAKVVAGDSVVGEGQDHSGAVTCLAFSPDGRRLASTGLDGVLVIRDRDLKEAQPVKVGSPLYAVAFSPNGQTLAVGGGPDRLEKDATPLGDEEVPLRADKGPAGVLRMLNPATGKQALTLRQHALAVTCVAWSPDGRLLAAGSLDRTVSVWDGRDGAPGFVLDGHGGPVRAVAWSPDGKTLAAGEGGVVRLWDVAGRKSRGTLDGHGNVLTLAFSPDGRFLAAGTDTSKTVKPGVRLWELAGEPSGEKRSPADGPRDDRPRPDPPPNEAGDGLDKFVARWQKKMDAVEGLELDLTYRQSQNDSVFEGVVKYLKPDQFLMEMRPKGDPAVIDRLFVDGRQLEQSFPNKKLVHRERLPAGESCLPMVLLGLRPDEAHRRFMLKVAKEDQYYLYLELFPRTEYLEMLPRAEADRWFFRRAQLVLARDTLLPRRLWLEQPDKESVTWDVLRADPDFRAKPEELARPAPAGWKSFDPQPEARPGEGTGKVPAVGGDPFADLVRELAKGKRGDAEAVDALFLATLARYPTETERRLSAEDLARHKDRAEGLNALVGQLTATQEFADRADALRKRGPRP
jgi:RNA polymerase sigma factor (sigma-70 family)